MLDRGVTRPRRFSIWSIVAMLMLGFLSACGGGNDDKPPVVPTGITAVGGDEMATLNWVASAKADSYNVYWSTTPGVTTAAGTKISGITSPTYAHTGLTNGLTYYYIVTAVNEHGESAATSQVSAVLLMAAPTSVAVVGGDGQATIDWQVLPAASAYNLYWSTTAGVTPANGTKIAGVTSPFVHEGLTNGLAYYYVITAVNATGESAASAEATVTLAPGAPGTVSAVSGDHQVTIDWRDVIGATSYNLYWSNTAGVTQATGTKIENAKAPYVQTGLTNGTTYYYVVTAMGAGGQSKDSEQVSAMPQVPIPGSPQGLAATLTPETTKSVTLQWSAPLPPTDPADILSYNLYRSTTPGIASNLAAATKTTGVVSPHIDLVPAGQVTYYYVVTAVTAGGEGAPSAEVSATPRGSPGTGSGGGGEPTGFGNNLSVPLLFADGLGILGAELTGTDYTDLATGLRPLATDIVVPFPYFDAATIYLLGGIPYYEQQSVSTWQASWLNGKASVQGVEVDWGDNLTSAALSVNQVIRVETVLRQYKGGSSWPDGTSMQGYPMQLLYGTGATEMQGTTGVATEATERRVYTVVARLRIQKVENNVPIDHVCGFNGSIAEGLAAADGKGAAKYSSEINVGGSLTYGFNWRINQCGATDKNGTWRLTFSFDDEATVGGKVYMNNTRIESLHPSETKAVVVDEKTTFVNITLQ